MVQRRGHAHRREGQPCPRRGAGLGRIHTLRVGHIQPDAARGVRQAHGQKRGAGAQQAHDDRAEARPGAAHRLHGSGRIRRGAGSERLRHLCEAQPGQPHAVPVRRQHRHPQGLLRHHSRQRHPRHIRRAPLHDRVCQVLHGRPLCGCQGGGVLQAQGPHSARVRGAL